VLKDSARKPGEVIIIPPGLHIPDTYLIFSEIDYKYTPAVGYVMDKLGITLKDVSYTRPRQSRCVDYPGPVAPTPPCKPA
jgi:hypothetical protein